VTQTNAQRAANVLEGYVVDKGHMPAESAAALAGLAQVYATLAVADEIRVLHRTLAAWMQTLAEDPGSGSRAKDAARRSGGSRIQDL
jgi:hypothetical protein